MSDQAQSTTPGSPPDANNSGARAAAALETLQPTLLWQHFAELCRIPRPSRGEERVVAYVQAWCEQHDLHWRADATGNLLISVPASSGMEGPEAVVLQAHLDMVGEKNAGVEHDFERDPIQAEVRGEWVQARGTTLGADNGIGVAAAMAVATDPGFRHGPLQLLFTLNEETGLKGALGLDPKLVSGRILLNLDTEEEGSLYIGCAGAGGLDAVLPLARQETRPGRAEDSGRQAMTLAVVGLRGGHSGMEISEGRGNAVQIAARALLQLARDHDTELVSLDGGGKRNAIPRECFAQVQVAQASLDQAAATLDEVQATIGRELAGVEPDLRIELRAVDEVGGNAAAPITHECRDRLLRWLVAWPNGVRALSREMPGLVETSCNLATVSSEVGELSVHCSCRSSSTPALGSLLESLAVLGQLAGARTTVLQGYPGWQPQPGSPLVRRAAEVYASVAAQSPEIKAVHAGLECGVLADRLEGLQAVSFGPDIRGAHSPDERAHIASVGRFYSYLGALLQDLGQRPLQDEPLG